MGLLLSIFIGRPPPAPPTAQCSAPALAIISTATVIGRLVVTYDDAQPLGRNRNPVKPCGLLYGMLALVISSSEPSFGQFVMAAHLLSQKIRAIH
jgi:hypothetical protein